MRRSIMCKYWTSERSAVDDGKIITGETGTIVDEKVNGKEKSYEAFQGGGRDKLNQ